MSAAALDSILGNGAPNVHGSPCALAQSLRMNPLGDSDGGRNAAVSPMPSHQLHVLAVHQLAASYRAGEIASSGMAMEGGSVCEDSQDTFSESV